MWGRLRVNSKRGAPGTQVAHSSTRRRLRRQGPGRDPLTMAPALGIRIGPAWRVVGETETIDTLLAEGWAPDAVRRDRPRAEREAHVVLERLIGLGLGVSVREGRRFFDPAEMINFALWASQQHGDPFWSKVSVPNARHFVWRAHRLAPREHGPPPAPSTLPPRRFTVRLARRVALEGLAPGTPVRLRLPAPIEDATARVSSAEGRIDVRLSAPASLSVELGYEASFLAAPASVAPEAPLSEAERARYLRASEGLVRVTRPIAELAARIAGEEADPWAQVVRFWRFLLETTLGGAVDYDEIDLARPQEWTIENRWTDCQMASALLVALSRARAIPARLLRGYVLDEQGPYYQDRKSVV